METLLAISWLFLLVIPGSRRMPSVGDATGETLQPLRVQAAQGLALAQLSLYALLLVHGPQMVGLTAPRPARAVDLNEVQALRQTGDVDVLIGIAALE